MADEQAKLDEAAQPARNTKSDTQDDSENTDDDLDGLVDSLHRELSLGADAMGEMKKVLILLDFNGTLVFRAKDEASSRIKKIKPHFSVRYSQFFIRPFANELVCHLLNDPRCQVGIYTSMMAKNMLEVLEGFDDYYQKMSREGKFDPIRVGKSNISTPSSLVHNSIALFDQPYNARDDQGSKIWDTKRDLKRIWSDSRIKQEGYGALNTLMVDAEARKVRDWKANSIIIQEFGETDVLTGGDRALVGLLKYLDGTVMPQMQQGKTIPEITSTFPFQT